MTYRDMTWCLGDGCMVWDECLRHVSRLPEGRDPKEPISQMATGFVDGVCKIGIFAALDAKEER